MTARVINDPSALGWEFDPDTGRWTWGGGSGSGGDGGGGSFPEAPVDGKQYGRQNAGWTEIVHTDGGGTSAGITSSMVKLENPTRLPTGLENQQDANAYIAQSLDKLIDQDGNVIKGGIEEAPDDGSIYGRKNQDWVVVPTGGGGGGDVDLSGYYTAAQCDSKFEPKFTKNTAFNKNFGTSSGTVAQGNHDHNGVYQPAGSYAAANHNHSGVYAPASHTHNYAAVGASYTKAESDNKYELKGQGGSSPDTLQDVCLRGATTNQSISAPNFHCGTDNYTLGGTTSGGARILVSNGMSFTGANSAALVTFSTNGSITAVGDVTAYSDVRLKEDIKTLDGSKVYQMRGVSFTKDGRDGSGVIAQELREVAPELVNEDGEYLSVAYGNLVGYLIEAVKELKAEVEELKRAK